MRWAARQAELTGATLRVVMTWHIQAAPYYPGPMILPGDVDREYQQELDRAVAEILAERPALAVAATLVEGRPALVLLEAAETADLLVVGSRGHGAFAGMLLGSVSQHCVAHAPCPVVVVRHRTREGDKPDAG